MATMYVYNIPTNETVNLRETPSQSSTIMKRIPYGAEVDATRYNSTWHSVSYWDDGIWEGYVMSQYLTSTNPNGGGSGLPSDVTGPRTAGYISTQTDPLSIRSGPGTSYSVLFSVPKGANVYFYKTTNSSWHYVDYNGQKGYGSSQYITAGSGGGNPGTPTKGVSFFASTTSSSAMTYTGPDYSYATNTGFTSSDVWTFTGGNDSNAWKEWLLIERTNGTFYLPAKYAGANEYSSVGEKAKIVVSSGGVNLRVGPSTSSSVITTLSSGTYVRAINRTSISGWWRVVTIDGTGWVSSQYITLV